jgi:hypothetical protein
LSRSPRRDRIDQARIALSSIALRVARETAALGRIAPIARHAFPPALGAEPREYGVIPIAKKLGLATTWRHATIAQLPREERYPRAMRLPKALVAAALRAPLGDNGVLDRRDVEHLHRWLGRPRLARGEHPTDEVFAWLRVQGPNPSWLVRCRDSEHASALDIGAGSLPADSDAYVLPYLELLRDLPSPGRHTVAPCAAIFRETAGQLVPHAIEIERPDRSRWIVRPHEGSAWELAKRFVQSADVFVHEVVSHYLWTHIVAEKFLLATARRLSRGHPVREWLAPHFAYTLQANENSSGRLLGEGGVFDLVFSVGWEGTLRMIERADRLWRWNRIVLPEDCRERGVERLRHHPYLEDGGDLYALVAEYAQGFVGSRYRDDRAVRADPELTE